MAESQQKGSFFVPTVVKETKESLTEEERQARESLGDMGGAFSSRWVIEKVFQGKQQTA